MDENVHRIDFKDKDRSSEYAERRTWEWWCPFADIRLLDKERNDWWQGLPGKIVVGNGQVYVGETVAVGGLSSGVEEDGIEKCETKESSIFTDRCQQSVQRCYDIRYRKGSNISLKRHEHQEKEVVEAHDKSK